MTSQFKEIVIHISVSIGDSLDDFSFVVDALNDGSVEFVMTMGCDPIKMITDGMSEFYKLRNL